MEMGSGNVTRDKNGKKKNQIISIDGGVGGLVVLGGAMAVTIVMVIATAFSGKKTSGKNVNLEKEEELDCTCSSEDDVIVIQRLRSLDDQDSKSTHQDSCCRRCSRPKISRNLEASQFMSGRSMVLDKLASKNIDESPTYDQQETLLLSDDSRPETVASRDENGTLAEETPNNSYFGGQKLDRSESLMSEETTKVKASFRNRKKTHETETENDAENERNSETKSTLHKREGKTPKKDEILKKEDINDGTGREYHDNTSGLKFLNKEVLKKSMAKNTDLSNHPVRLRIRILFMMLLSVPFFILFLTYTAARYLDNHSSIVIA